MPQGRLTEIFDLFRLPDWLGQISTGSLRADLFAGLTGATLVLPQGVAFAAIAGLPPEYGFYTAMVTPVVAALTGSSWHSVSGPTTAISALVFAALAGSLVPGSPEFVSAAIALTLLVGLFQFVLGIARFGGLVDFVSHSVMTGFVTAAALLIGLSQIRHALGLDLPRPDHIVEFFSALGQSLPETDWRALTVTAAAFLVAIVTKKFWPLWPNYLIALAVATVVSLPMQPGLATIGAIESVIPRFELPNVTPSFLQDFSTAAIAIAMVGLLEAMSIARALSMKSGQMVDGNREFLGQGSSNIVGSFFQCYPGSASFTRSGVNYDAGARTPLSAIFAALFLFLILLLVAPLFAYVPIPAMAGVILLVAWRLIDFYEIRHILATSNSEIAIAIVTFGAALFINLETGIYAGVLLSLALFLNRTSKPFLGVGAPDPSTPGRAFKHAADHNLDECPQFMIARLDGPLYFGSVEFLRRQFRRFEVERQDQKHILFIVKGVGEIDLPGADLMLEEAKRRIKRGGSFHLQTKTPRTITKLGRFRVMKGLGKEHFHLTKAEAIAAIVPTLDQSICATCKTRIFRECPRMPHK